MDETLARTIAHKIYHHIYPNEADHNVIYDLADNCVPEVERGDHQSFYSEDRMLKMIRVLPVVAALVLVAAQRADPDRVPVLLAALSHAQQFAGEGGIRLDYASKLPPGVIVAIAARSGASVGSIDGTVQCRDTIVRWCAFRDGVGVIVTFHHTDVLGDSATVKLELRYVTQRPDEAPVNIRIDELQLVRRNGDWTIAHVRNLMIT